MNRCLIFFKSVSEQNRKINVFTCSVGIQNRSSAEYHVDDVANVLELLQCLHNADGYRHVGSVLEIAGRLDDDEYDEERDSFEISYDSSASFTPHRPTLKISHSVPAGFGIDLEDEEEVDPFHVQLRSREDRPPSF